ncbi:serine hydrolase [Saliphagus sp. LR7]|uniref:serine hydrolase n=1 Tax=Saliphagus sp. LR7 TaxID=2282654 RepID=UPI000DF7888D|nr:serine hydrolase [Saliphagus sp. LR7]
MGERARTTADRIDSFLGDWREDEDVPGVSAVVFDEQGVRVATGLGEREAESGAPATPDTLYSVASLSKPVVALAVLRLIDQGEIDLDGDIGAYVPILDDVPGDPITVEELLSHSSGIPRDFSALHGTIDDGQDLGLLEHVRGAADQRLLDRDRYMYSNGGYFVLGELIEAVDGRPYDRYVGEEVLDPLGMERSTFDPDALRTDDDAMTGYAERDGELVVKTYDGGAGSAGGLISSPRELTRLGRCVLDGGEVEGSRILDSDLLAKATSIQSSPLPTSDDSRRGYGYGWEIGEFAEQLLASHLGGIDGASAYIGVLPEDGLGVALALNRHGPPAATLGQAVLAIACGEEPADRVRAIKLSEVVETVSGTYGAYRNAETVVVEPVRMGLIELTVEGFALSVTASPEEIGDDRYVFSVRPGDGALWLAEFRETETGLELVLSMGKWTTVLTEQ